MTTSTDIPHVPLPAELDCGCIIMGGALPIRIPCAECSRGYGQAIQILGVHRSTPWQRVDGPMWVCAGCSTRHAAVRWPCRQAGSALAFMQRWSQEIEGARGDGDEAVEGAATPASAGGARPRQRPAQQGAGVDQEAAAAGGRAEPGQPTAETPQSNTPQVPGAAITEMGRAAGLSIGAHMTRVLAAIRRIGAPPLTAAEHEALRLTAELANTLSEVVGDGPNRAGDLDELVSSIHQIQRAVLAQAAGRAYPDLYRLLGQPAPGSS